MPKIIIGEENRRSAALLEYIDAHVGRGRQFRFDCKLADALDMSQQVFCGRRKDPSKFGFDELCLLFRATHASGHELCRIFGVKDDAKDGQTKTVKG